MTLAAANSELGAAALVPAEFVGAGLLATEFGSVLQAKKVSASKAHPNPIAIGFINILSVIEPYSKTAVGV
jgi:hypothetical protein